MKSPLKYLAGSGHGGRRRRWVFLDAAFPFSCYALSHNPSDRDFVMLDEESFGNVDRRALVDIFGPRRIRWQMCGRRVFRLLRLAIAASQMPCVLSDPFGRAARISHRCEVLPDGAGTLWLLDRTGKDYSMDLPRERQFVTKPTHDGLAYLLGQNYVEFGAISRAVYRELLQEISRRHPGIIRYIPHPREKTRPEDLPASYIWTDPELPIELRLLGDEYLPEFLLTFSSTATISVPMLFPSIKVISVDVKLKAIEDLQIFLTSEVTVTHSELSAFIYRLLDSHGLKVSRMELDNVACLSQ